MTIFTGNEAKQVGFAVKSRLRNFIASELNGEPYAARYRKYTGADVVLAQQLEEETPNDKPLLSIRTVERDRKEWSHEGKAGYLHYFTLGIRVMADSDSGGLITAPDAASADEALSDDLDDLLTKEGTEDKLSALGIQHLVIGKRESSVNDGVHTNDHSVTFVVATLP